MKNKTFTAMILLAFAGTALAAPLWAQTEADFQVAVTQDGQGVRILRYTGTIMDVVIPATIQGMPVREIAPETFRLADNRRMDITSVVIPEGVTLIEARLFSPGFERLASVTLPSTITSIGQGAFMNTPALRSITLPEGLVEIGQQAFANSGITSITIPASAYSIGDSAFAGSAITSITWHGRPGLIQVGMFNRCINLQTVVIPEGVSRIGDLAFAGCTALTSVTLPSTITSIYDSAFGGCTALTTVTIPETIERIRFGSGAVGGDVFRECNQIPLATQAHLRRLGYTGVF